MNELEEKPTSAFGETLKIQTENPHQLNHQSYAG